MLFIIFRFVILSCLLLLVLNVSENSVASGFRIKRVIGGSEVKIGSYPIFVSIKSTTTGNHLCGGTLIRQYLVLTAAHCVEKQLPSEFSIHLDNIETVDINADNKTTISGVTKNTIHPDYGEISQSHDIAIMQLDKAFSILEWDFENLLPKSSFGLSGDCNIYGYGMTEMNSNITYNPLRVAAVQIISNEECIELLGKYVAPKADSGMICALGNFTDACQGDSGSGLMCDGILEGIVSYGMGCGHSLPGVYTRVAEHLKWIQSVMENMKMTSRNDDKAIFHKIIINVRLHT